jgi:hypothetical protein
MDTFLLDPLLRAFLAEDLEHGDITTEAIFTPEDRAQAAFIARHPMTVVGMEIVAGRVFRLLDPSVACTAAMADGSHADTGDQLLRLSGPTRALLRGERGADQQAQHGFGDVRRHAETLRGRARVQDHVALATEVPRRMPRRARRTRDLAREPLALGHEREQFAIDVRQAIAELAEVHGTPRGRSPI